jgi:hypothetical protein
MYGIAHVIVAAFVIRRYGSGSPENYAEESASQNYEKNQNQ